MRKVIYSENFRQNLKEISIYIIDNFGVDVYLRFDLKFKKTINNLKVFPRIGMISERKKWLDDAEHVFTSGPNLIYYTFNDEKIILLKISSNKQNR